MRKGQAITWDFLIGFFIFMIAVVITSQYILNYKVLQEGNTVSQDSRVIADMLNDDGFPTNWDENSVVKIGLLSDGELNITKLASINSLDYEAVKAKLGVTSDFVIQFSNNNGSIVSLEGCSVGDPELQVDGNCVIDFDSVSYDELLPIRRMIVYNQTLMIAWVYVYG